MRRWIPIFLMLATAVTSCNKFADPFADRTIAFSTNLDLSLKSTSRLDTTRVFGSYAWRTTGTWASTPDASKLSTPFMVNVSTKYSKSIDSWTPGSYRWPTTSSYLHFACYSPFNSSTPMSFSVSGGIAFPNYEAGDDDLLYSDVVKDQACLSTPSVPLTFHHALGQVVVKVKKAAVPSQLSGAVSSVEVKLLSIKFSGIKNTGSFTQNSNPQWSGVSGSYEKTLFSGSKTLTETADGKDISMLYVLPQAFADGVQKITVGYSVKTSYTNGTSTSVKSFTDVSDLYDMGLTAAWASGKSVRYTITISAFTDNVTFEPSTEDWVEQTVIGQF